MDHAGHWTDQPHHGRPLGPPASGGLGTAAAHSGVSLVRRLAVDSVLSALPRPGRRGRGRWRSPAVGAAELLSFEPGNSAALRLLADYAATVARPRTKSDWPWPEPELTYANAILPEAMIAAGVALDDSDLKQRGLDLLEWLRSTYETIDGPLSPTPAGRPGTAGTAGPAFDKQPIEVATLDRSPAATRDAAADPRPLWPDGIRLSARLVPGRQRLRVASCGTPETRGGFDGFARRVRQPQPGCRIDRCW